MSFRYFALYMPYLDKQKHNNELTTSCLFTFVTAILGVRTFPPWGKTFPPIEIRLGLGLGLG